MGELRNNIKIITARSFAANLDKCVIPITLHDLPKEFLDQSIKLVPDENELPIRLDEQTNLVSLLEKQSLRKEELSRVMNESFVFMSHHHHLSTANNDISKEIERLFDDLLFEKKREKSRNAIVYYAKYPSIIGND